MESFTPFLYYIIAVALIAPCVDYLSEKVILQALGAQAGNVIGCRLVKFIHEAMRAVKSSVRQLQGLGILVHLM